MAHPVWHTADQKTASSASSNSQTVDVPDNLSEGDELVAFWMLWQEIGEPAEDVSVPDGWSIVTTVFGDRPSITVMRKRASASEPADYEFSYDGTAGPNAIVVGRVSGLNQFTAIEAVETFNGIDTSIDLAETTGMRDEDYLRVAAFANRTESGTHSGVSISSPATFTDVFSDEIAGEGFSYLVAIEDDLNGTTASEVTATNTNTRWAALYLVFREPQESDANHPEWHRGDEKTASGTGTSLTADRPGNYAEDDLFIALWENREGSLSASDFTVPSGWTLIGEEPGSSDNPATIAWYKVAGASEPTSYEFSHSGGSADATLVIGRVTGYDETTPTAHVETADNIGADQESLAGLTGLTDDSYLRVSTAACRTASGSHRGPLTFAPANSVSIEVRAEASSGFSAGVELEYFSGTTADMIEWANDFVRWSALSFVVQPGDGGGGAPGGDVLEIDTESLPDGVTGAAYSSTLAASGGTEPYSWSTTAGALPDGLTLNASTGEISGTPTEAGTFDFTVQVEDDASETDTQELSIEVTAATVDTTILPLGRVAEAYSETLEASGGTAPYEWAVTVGSLPDGLSLTAGTGEISGTPTTDGTSEFTVEVTDDNGETDTQVLEIRVLGEDDHYTDFSEYDTGSLPAEWVNQWDASASYTIEADAEAAGGKWFRQDGSGDSDPKWVQWTDIPDGAHQLVETVIQNDDSTSTTRRHGGVVLRGAGTEGNETGYIIYLRYFFSPGRHALQILRLEDGVETILATEPEDGSGGDSVWLRGTFFNLVVEARGGLIRARIWEKGTTDPESWTLEVTDPSPLAAGGVGYAGGRSAGNSNNFVDEFLYLLNPDSGAVPPDQPTVQEAECPNTTLFVETSGFSTSDPEPNHTDTRYQVRLDGAADWETLVVPEITTTDFLTSVAIDGMPESTDLEVRAAHGQDGVYSDFSDPVAVTSGTETPLPETPSITDPVDDVGTDYVTITRSAFDHTEGVGDGEPDEDGEVLPYELAVQFQVRESGASWDDAVIDTGLDELYVDVVTLTFEGLDPDTSYEIRFRTQDGLYGATSAWSNVVAFTTDAIPAVQPVTPTLTVDSCGWPETEVSSSAFDHPEGGAAHAASRWWIGIEGSDEVVRYDSIITSDAAELTEFVWRQLAEGVNHLAVSHRDDSGRWSDRSDPVTCEVRERPDVPVLTSHAAGTSIDEDTTFEWSMPGDDTWLFTGELSSDDGATFEGLFSGQEEAEHTLSIDGRASGLYLLRIRACYPVEPTDCSDWLYIPFRIDRSGVVSVDYRFSEMEELLATWVPMWDPTGAVEWALVDQNLDPIDEEGAGQCIGLHAQHTDYLQQRESVLAFTELDNPDLLDITVSFAILQNPYVWHGWRFSQSRYLSAGPAYRVVDADETGDEKAGYAARVIAGGRGWAYSNACTSDAGGLSDAARRDKPQVARMFPDRLLTYGVSVGGATTRMYGYREMQSRHWLYQTGAIGTAGDLSRGLTYSTPREDEPDEEDGNCFWNRAVSYSARKRVTRTLQGNYRIRVQVFGPGIDPAQGPQIDHEIDPDEVVADGWTFGDALCGACGLHYWQLPFITEDPGVLFFSASITLPDTTILSGPVLGTATVVGEG